MARKRHLTHRIRQQIYRERAVIDRLYAKYGDDHNGANEAEMEYEIKCADWLERALNSLDEVEARLRKAEETITRLDFIPRTVVELRDGVVANITSTGCTENAVIDTNTETGGYVVYPFGTFDYLDSGYVDALTERYRLDTEVSRRLRGTPPFVPRVVVELDGGIISGIHSDVLVTVAVIDVDDEAEDRENILPFNALDAVDPHYIDGLVRRYHLDEGGANEPLTTTEI